MPAQLLNPFVYFRRLQSCLLMLLGGVYVQPADINGSTESLSEILLKPVKVFGQADDIEPVKVLERGLQHGIGLGYGKVR